MFCSSNMPLDSRIRLDRETLSPNSCSGFRLRGSGEAARTRAPAVAVSSLFMPRKTETKTI